MSENTLTDPSVISTEATTMSAGLADRFISTINSYTGLLKNRTSFRRVCQLRDAIADDWWQWIDWDQRRLCVMSKPQHTFRQRLCKKYNLKLKRL